MLSICNWSLVIHKGKESEVVVGPSVYCTFVHVLLMPFLHLCAALTLVDGQTVFGGYFHEF